MHLDHLVCQIHLGYLGYPFLLLDPGDQWVLEDLVVPKNKIAEINATSRLTTNSWWSKAHTINEYSKQERNVNSALDDYIHVRKSHILLTVCRLKKRVASQSFQNKMAIVVSFSPSFQANLYFL